jgi:hypothetical protein
VLALAVGPPPPTVLPVDKFGSLRVVRGTFVEIGVAGPPPPWAGPSRIAGRRHKLVGAVGAAAVAGNCTFDLVVALSSWEDQGGRPWL